MLPQSITTLLAGEGYILAAFFGLLVPIYLFRRDEGVAVSSRYGRALINLKAMTLVAIVLLVAACYEAVEVILMITYAGICEPPLCLGIRKVLQWYNAGEDRCTWGKTP